MAVADFLPFLFGLIIGLPSAILNCFELAIIFSHFSHFRSSFFMLVIVRSIASLVNYVFAFLAHRFGKIGLFLPIYLAFPRPILASLYFVSYYAFHVENLITAFMLLNRLTSIIWTMDYEKFWRICLPISLAITFAVPLPFTLPIFGLDMYIHVQSDNVTFTLDDHKIPNELDSAEIAAFSAIIFSIICLLINLASLFAYKFAKQQNLAAQNSNTKMERKLTIYTVVTFFGHLVMALFMLLVYLSATNLLDDQNNRYSYFQKWLSLTTDQNDTLFLAIFNQGPWVNDLCTVTIPAWLILWASSKMREIGTKIFTYNIVKKNFVVPIGMASNNQHNDS